MATKKQKRAAAEEKRARFLEEMKQSGLEAQRKDQEIREKKNLAEWQNNHDKNHSWKKRIKECPHCQLETKPAKVIFTKLENVKGNNGQAAAENNHIKESIA